MDVQVKEMTPCHGSLISALNFALDIGVKLGTKMNNVLEWVQNELKFSH